jgi:gag-polypeptide of LTR copia-type
MWDQLKGMYKGRSSALTISTWRKLQNTRCKEDEDVHVHFHQLQESWERLVGMGKPITDNDFASVLIVPLPPTYDELL